MTNNHDSIGTKATLLFISSLTVMAGATIAPSLPAMNLFFKDQGGADFLVKLVLTIPALFIAIGAPIAGVIVDRWGRKKLLLFSLILYGLAGSSGFFLNSLYVILIGRSLLGMSVAGIMTCATVLIADYYKDQARTAFLGLQAAFMSLGGVVFLSGGGLLADLNWRFPFLIYLAAFLIFPFVLLLIVEPDRTVSARNYDSSKNLVMPAKLLVLIFAVALVGQVIFYMIPVQMPFYLKSKLAASPKLSGFAIAITTLFSAASSLLYQRLRDHINFVSITGLTFLLMAIGYIIIGWSNGFLQIVSGLIVSGLGLGMMIPNLNVWLTSEVPIALRGRALGGLTAALCLGQFLSPIIIQPISQRFGLGSAFASVGTVMIVIAAIFVYYRQQFLKLQTEEY